MELAALRLEPVIVGVDGSGIRRAETIRGCGIGFPVEPFNLPPHDSEIRFLLRIQASGDFACGVNILRNPRQKTPVQISPAVGQHFVQNKLDLLRGGVVLLPFVFDNCVQSLINFGVAQPELIQKSDNRFRLHTGRAPISIMRTGRNAIGENAGRGFNLPALLTHARFQPLGSAGEKAV